jgi:hypothetical protein
MKESHSKGHFTLNKEQMLEWDQRIEQAKLSAAEDARKKSGRELKAENRKLKKYLKELTATTSHYLACIDVLHDREHSAWRDGQVAQLTNYLEYANDQARYFGLGVDYRTDDKRKEKLRREVS